MVNEKLTSYSKYSMLLKQKQDDQLILGEIEKIKEFTDKEYNTINSLFHKRLKQLIFLKKDVKFVEAAKFRRIEFLQMLNKRKSQLISAIEEETKDCEKIEETSATYEHMLNRLKTEQDALRRKIASLESSQRAYNSRIVKDKRDFLSKEGEQKRLGKAVDMLKKQIDEEGHLHDDYLTKIKSSIEQQKVFITGKSDVENWKVKLNLYSQTKDPSKSLNLKLRRMLAIEKLVGNALKNVSNIEEEKFKNKAEALENLKIYTGTMDSAQIVKKYVNKESEITNLQDCVKDLEEQISEVWKKNVDLKREIRTLSTWDGTFYDEVNENAYNDHFNEALKKYKLSQKRYENLVRNIYQIRKWASLIETFVDTGNSQDFDMISFNIPILRLIGKIKESLTGLE